MQEFVLMGFLWYFVLVFSLTAHEAAHAFAGWRLGDPTAYHGGQVTLNPMPHIRREPFGMVILPIITYAIGGWMMGWASAPYNPWWADRYPYRAALMSFAGPATNLAISLVAGLVLRWGLASGFFDIDPNASAFGAIVSGSFSFISIAFTLNLILAVFNMLPVPPLDGSALLEIMLRGSALETYRGWRRHPYAGIVGLLIAWHIFSPVFRPIHEAVMRVFFPGT
ncbi:MAG TPA: site-2 protease family protein [Sedimentisphaerales bacterium]|nr:site-2 protease family protein [Sedimentisphaerales bacterium]